MGQGFEEEELPKMQYTYRISRFSVPGGWYLRVIFRNRSGSQGNHESAIFLSDPDHQWQLGNTCWEKLKKEPNGGVYRLPVHGGWVLLATAQGIAETDDGTRYKPRMGSLTFVPDEANAWACNRIEETTSVF